MVCASNLTAGVAAAASVAAGAPRYVLYFDE